MYRIAIETAESGERELVVKPTGLNRVRAARDTVRVPLAKIRGVHIPREVQAHGPIFHRRLAGAEVPRPAKLSPAAAFDSSGSRGQTLVIELDEHERDELVVRVHDPYSAARMIRDAVAAKG